MIGNIYTANINGVVGELVKVEVSIDNGIPSFYVVGLAGGAIKESIQRIKPAFSNSEIIFPKRKVTINLVPAGKRKEGSHFDLPIAMAILAAEKEMEEGFLDKYGVLGEMSLDGKINPVKGALPICMKLIEEGKEKIILPKGNFNEVSILKEGKFFPVEKLEDVLPFFEGKEKCFMDKLNTKRKTIKDNLDFADVYGQEGCKRCLEISAAGFHGIMMWGSPGVGKTMLAKRLKTILPKMTEKEILETTKIYSIAGLLSENESIIDYRPFRMPHHTITPAGIFGGGIKATVGEITLAHNGVLFLDEFSNFDIKVINGLREPLEEKKVAIARLGGSAIFPANTLLVGATNPCKCGNFGDNTRVCTCTPSQITSFNAKFSSPILDRIDLHIYLGRIEKEFLDGINLKNNIKENYYTSSKMRERVEEARKIQSERYIKEKINLNSEMTGEHFDKYLSMTKGAKDTLHMAYEKMGLTIRGYNKIKKISRTIADLDGCEKIEIEHVGESLQYRKKEERM